MRNAAAEQLLRHSNSTGLSVTDDAFAMYMDEIDPLKEHRSAFHFPIRQDGTPYTYMAGHTLGLQHVGVEASINSYLRKWREQGVEGYNMQPSPWAEVDTALRKDMASIVGASESEVVIMNSHIVNLNLLMTVFFQPTGKRRKILTENHGAACSASCFAGQLEMRDLSVTEDVILVSATGKDTCEGTTAIIPTEAFLSAMERRGEEIAVVLLSPVHFMTGQLFDVETIVKAAHAKNILVGLDCAYAVGNIPLRLHDWDVDFACWSTYKFINSGPGNIGGAFVHSKHTMRGNKLKHLRGRLGHDQLNRQRHYSMHEPEEGAAAFQMSNISILGIAALEPGLQLMAQVGMEALREKSMLLTAYMELLLQELLPAGCAEQITPVDPAQRGAQLSLRVSLNRLRSESASHVGYESSFDDYGTCDADVAQQQLLDEGVICDSCAPDVIRLAPAPLYNSFADVLTSARAVGCLFSGV